MPSISRMSSTNLVLAKIFLKVSMKEKIFSIPIFSARCSMARSRSANSSMGIPMAARARSSKAEAHQFVALQINGIDNVLAVAVNFIRDRPPDACAGALSATMRV
jgi:hypothetical protein